MSTIIKIVIAALLVIKIGHFGHVSWWYISLAFVLWFVSWFFTAVFQAAGLKNEIAKMYLDQVRARATRKALKELTKTK